MTLATPSHKAILVLIATIAVVCLQFVGIATSEPENKRIFVIVGWIPYAYVFMIAIQGLRSKGYGDEMVSVRCAFAFILGIIMCVMLTQTDLLNIATVELWNKYLVMDVFVTLLVAIGATS